MTNLVPTCWIITEGIAGTENQCIGVARALGLLPEMKRIQLNQPWKLLSPYLAFEREATFSTALTPPWPDLLITSGRKSIAASRYIKRKSGGKTFTVHIQDPRINPHCFDLLAVPAHDPTRGKNVIVTTAAPNKITPSALENAKHAFPRFADLKAPRIAVLIGGNSKAYQMNDRITENLVEKLRGLQGSLMITCSRRTGERNKNIILSNLATESNYIWDGFEDNPYLALLAWADFILVTADSVSMLSEGCSTGKPVYMIPLSGGTKRILALHNNLKKMGAMREFTGTLEKFSYEPLNDAKLVANEIKKRSKLFTDST